MGTLLQLKRPAPEAPSKVADSELVRRALTGELLAQELLYGRHFNMAYGLAHRLLAGKDTEDVVQESFLDAFEKLARLDDPQSFAKWLGSIIVNNARAQIRRQRRWRRFKAAEPIEAEQIIAPNAPADVRAELLSVYSVLHELPEDVRLALVLRRVEGLKISEVANLMGCSPATVKRRIQDGDFFVRSSQERA